MTMSIELTTARAAFVRAHQKREEAEAIFVEALRARLRLKVGDHVERANTKRRAIVRKVLIYVDGTGDHMWRIQVQAYNADGKLAQRLTIENQWDWSKVDEPATA